VTSFYGADNDAAIGAAILQHALNFAPVTLLGLWFLARDGINLTRLREISSTAKEDAALSSGGDSAGSAREVTP